MAILRAGRPRIGLTGVQVQLDGAEVAGAEEVGPELGVRPIRTTKQRPRISFSFSMEPPARAHCEAKVCSVAWYQRRPGWLPDPSPSLSRPG